MPAPVSGRPPGIAIGGGAGARGAGASRVVIGPFRNVDKALAQIEGLKTSIPDQAIRATAEELERLLAYAKELAPEDRGHLKKSGRVLGPRRVGGDQVDFQVMFGGVAVESSGLTRFVDYAELVHETQPDKAGWLSTAADTMLPGLTDRVASRINVSV